MPAPGPRFLSVPERVDDRGRLRIFELDQPLPFVPVRSFVISNVPEGKTRAGHIATCDQILAVLQGSCQLTVKTDTNEERHHLTPADGAIYIRRGMWLSLSDFQLDAVMLVFASERFDVKRDLPPSVNSRQDP